MTADINPVEINGEKPNSAHLAIMRSCYHSYEKVQPPIHHAEACLFQLIKASTDFVTLGIDELRICLVDGITEMMNPGS